MKILKIISAVLITVLIVIAALAYFVFKNINSYVEEFIESSGSQTMQTAVRVGGVNIELLEGKGTISNLSIANPEGFSANKLLSVSTAGLQLDIESLQSNVKVIKNINIDKVKLRAEQKGISDTNLQALLNNIKQASSSTAPASEASSSASNDIRLMVESLRFGESEITLETEKYGSKVITLPAYTQKNIGNKKTGLTPEQLSDAIVSNLLRKAEKAVKRKLRESAKDKAEEKLKEKLKEKIGDKISEDDVDKLKQLFK